MARPKIGEVKKSAAPVNRAAGKVTTETPKASIPPSPGGDLSKVVEQSRQALADGVKPKNKGGRPLGWRKDGSHQLPLSPPGIVPLTPQPGPAAPMYAKLHKATISSMASMAQKRFTLSDDDAKTLGEQLDVCIQWYLPDLEKNPKRLALYTYLFTLGMVGVAVVQAPSIKKTVKPNEPISPHGRANDSGHGVNTESSDVKSDGPQRVAGTQDPTQFFEQQDGVV